MQLNSHTTDNNNARGTICPKTWREKAPADEQTQILA